MSSMRKIILIALCYCFSGCLSEFEPKNTPKRVRQYDGEQNWLIFAPFSEKQDWNNYLQEKGDKDHTKYHSIVEDIKLNFAANHGIKEFVIPIREKLRALNLRGFDTIVVSASSLKYLDWLEFDFEMLVSLIKPGGQFYLPDDSGLPTSYKNEGRIIVPRVDGMLDTPSSYYTKQVMTAKEFVIWELGGISIDVLHTTTLAVGAFSRDHIINGKFTNVTFKSPFQDIFNAIKAGSNGDGRMDSIVEYGKDIWIDIFTELKLNASEEITNYSKILHNLTRMRMTLNKKIMEKYCAKVDIFDESSNIRSYPNFKQSKREIRRYYKCTTAQ